MRTIIAGTREVQFKKACSLVCDALEQCGFAPQITEIIHGDARGIDRAAKHVCAGFYPIIDVPAEWDKFGKIAGHVRNEEMAKMADALICVWDGKSPGSRNMISIAKQYGLKIYIHHFD